MSAGAYLALGVLLAFSLSGNVVALTLAVFWARSWKGNKLKTLVTFMKGTGFFRERIVVVDVDKEAAFEIHGCDECRAKLKEALRDAELMPRMASVDLQTSEADR